MDPMGKEHDIFPAHLRDFGVPDLATPLYQGYDQLCGCSSVPDSESLALTPCARASLLLCLAASLEPSLYKPQKDLKLSLKNLND
jgi:hypothetical protein